METTLKDIEIIRGTKLNTKSGYWGQIYWRATKKQEYNIIMLYKIKQTNAKENMQTDKQED